MKNFNFLLPFISILFIMACQNKAVNEEQSLDESSEVVTSTVDTASGLFAMIYTDRGPVIIKLFPDKAPMTVANFVALAEGSMPNTFRKAGQPYYDSLKFHRVISITNRDNENFMIQGGDPNGNGTGGPGYQFKDEFSDLKLDRPGILAMANSGPGTNGSQFFITLRATPHLDGVHTVFGEVISGGDIPFMIRTNDLIKKIKILRKGDQAMKFDAMAEFNKRK